MSSDDFSDFEHTGPETLAGRYLRLFWQPVYRSEDLPRGMAVPVRVMSEDFTLYRGEQGSCHLVAFRCAHRGTQLSTGWVEGDCIRCRYHGWKYDGSGQCVEQPGEEAAFAENVRIRSYPTEEYLGLVFAYLGDGDAPPLRRYPQFEQPGVLITLPPESWPCNYYNRLDNDPDMGHVFYTHDESLKRAKRTDRQNLRTVTAEETSYGVKVIASVPGRPQEFILAFMPNNFEVTVRAGMASASSSKTSQAWEDRMSWAVPLDDDNSYRFEVNLAHFTGDDAKAYETNRREALERSGGLAVELGEAVLAGKVAIHDLDPELSTYELFRVEDYVTQVGRDRMWKRSRDHLGAVDRAVFLRRKIWQRELKALAEGKPLKMWIMPETRNG
ncbi:MAG: Rieske 2Fe-2S domain-containing protein [Deltaproteobacteria bacterium]|nr:Rieske 2Fe-2S domain-containing protein [Deltaproteobacteria bacterium]